MLQLKQKRALVLDFTDGKRWTVPYYMLNLEGADARVNHEMQQGLSRHAIAVGDLLGFKDKQGEETFWPCPPSEYQVGYPAGIRRAMAGRLFSALPGS